MQDRAATYGPTYVGHTTVEIFAHPATTKRLDWTNLRVFIFGCRVSTARAHASFKVKLKYFLRYMEHQTDDSPLYIFDSHFDDHDVAKGLLEDFAVPSYFPDDLFSLVGERRRPPYR